MKKKEVLVLRRSESGARAGEYEIPGGMVEAGESLEAAAKRETWEETGIDLADIEFVKTSSYTANGQARLSGLFKASVQSNSVKLSSEHDDFKWVNANNYHNVNFEEHYVKLFKEYFETEVKKLIKKTENTKSTTYAHLIIYTDGGSRGNPGPSASGYVIMDEAEHVLEDGGEYLGVTTNNQAEYQAVKLGLENAKKYNPKTISFFIDSLLVVNQMIGKFKIKSKELWPIHEDIKRLSKQYEEVTYTHVKREFNTLADDEVNKVLDSYQHRNASNN